MTWQVPAGVWGPKLLPRILLSRKSPQVKEGWNRAREATGEMGEWVTPDLVSAATQGPSRAFLWRPCL